MKVLIVDDEKHVRSAINLLADWDRFGIREVLEATDGEDAVTAILEHAPQIVLTDMRMPRKDGAALLTWLHDEMPRIKVIVISGYDDFELMRHVIRNGGMDYILKPVKADALNEALGKAADCWRKEEEERKRLTRRSIEVNEMKPHYADKLLTDLVTGQSRRELLNQLLEKFRLPAGPVSCSVAVLAVSQIDSKLLAKFHNQHQLLFFTLSNICNELLRSRGVAFRQLNSPGELVLLFWDDASGFSSVLRDINEGIYLTLHRRFHFGIALSHAFPSEVQRGYREASRAVEKRNLLAPGHFHPYQEEDGASSKRQPRLASFEEIFRLAALSGSREQIQAAVDNWLAGVKQLGLVSPEQLMQWDGEWDWMLLKWIEGEAVNAEHAEEREEAKAETIVPLPLNEKGMLSWENLKAEMIERLEAASKTLVQAHAKNHFFIQDIAKYVESHYLEDISLQDVAARFFLSREYVARKFKQEYGVTLLDYLSRIRIEKAKLLLHNPHLRITQVAEMVGYQDEKYFSRVFKKLEGINPGEYRKERILG
ncbi:response regulator transcription factor [Paenibacillus spongiae]|uniref:Response regulator n=1 Tax=Paenibacillus spongiae TaxID=2909671 RepID=A0ABY5SCE3_9BACL|nr:response regulator [Paenibacillus spongiae]UVI30432.1 response regulator [Paenibacillus spongiae]